MQVRLLESDDVDPRWDRYVRRRGGSIYQLARWGGLLAKSYGHASYRLLAERSGVALGVLPLFGIDSPIFGRHLESMPGGALADDEAIAVALVREAMGLADRLNADHLTLRDARRAAPISELVTSEHHATLLLELPDGPGRLWRALSAKVRNSVRKARRAGLEVIVGGAELIAPFYRVFAANMRDLGSPTVGTRFVAKVFDTFDENAKVLVAQKAGQPVGGMVLLHHGELVVNPWTSSLRSHFADCPNDILYWEALSWSVRQGLRVFDFGRGQPGSGPFKFKAKWGGRQQTLFYQYYLRRGGELPDAALKMQRDPLYRLARDIWQRLPLPLANLVGPPLTRWINPLG